MSAAQQSILPKTAPVPLTLVDGEIILVNGAVHPAIFWKGAVLLVFGVLLLLTAAANLGLLFIFLGVLVLGAAAIGRHFLALILTNRRVIIRHGFGFFTDTVELRLSQIESVETARMLTGQIFGYANVVITGTGNRATVVPYIANAAEFRRAIDGILLKREENL